MRAMILVVLAAAGGAAEGVLQAFDPRPTPPELAWRAAGELRAYAAADARDGAGDLALDRAQASLAWLGLRGERDEVWLEAEAGRTALVGDVRLPDGGDPAGIYHDLGASATWKRLLGDGDLLGFSVRAGAEGQAGDLAATGGATLFGRVGLGAEGRDGLLLALDYDPDRVVLGEVPVLPLVAWQGMRGPWFLLVGVPFSSVAYRAEAWSATAVFGPLPSLSADLRLVGPLRLAGEARWSVMQVRRAERPDDDDRLRLSQWEWSGGLRLGFGPARRLELMAGLATARRLGEDEDGDDARRDGVVLEATEFAALRVRWMF